MEYHRKQAKALVREFRDGDPEAIRRAGTILGERAEERFQLSDAQHVIACEQGFRSWGELKQENESGSTWRDGEDVTVATDYRYGTDDAVEVIVRKRGWRYDISDGGRAVELAGRPADWSHVAEEVVEVVFALNVNRRGVVYVQANDERLESLVSRVAECSVALLEALLDRELGSP